MSELPRSYLGTLPRTIGVDFPFQLIKVILHFAQKLPILCSPSLSNETHLDIRARLGQRLSELHHFLSHTHGV